MGLMKLEPACKDYIWGGNRLLKEYGYKYDSDRCAEAWVLSAHPDGSSVIVNGEYAGKTLREYLDNTGMSVLGTNCSGKRDFPILIKFIDARDNLSIQVHPSDEYALKNEGQYGKTEMWYILDAAEGAFLYYGFNREISSQEFEKRIRNNTLLEVLNKVEVHKGDCLLIEAGTIHAIGKGIVLAEIQQNSNVTYRVYDYDRKDKNGNTRELHISKAIDVTERKPAEVENMYPHVADTDYFTVDRLHIDGNITEMVKGSVNEDSFMSALILEGNGYIKNGDTVLPIRKGDSFLLTAGSGDYSISGKAEALITTVRAERN